MATNPPQAESFVYWLRRFQELRYPKKDCTHPKFEPHEDKPTYNDCSEVEKPAIAEAQEAYQ